MYTIQGFLEDTIGAIAVLVNQNLYNQALVILYSAIDTLAWVNLPDGDVKGENFIAWVDKYIEPERKLSCTAADLYGARCGLVHSGSAESKSSRKGDTTEIWYVTSRQSINTLREHVYKHNQRARVIVFTDLLDAFMNGSLTFCDEIAQDKRRQLSVNKRIRLWLGFVPKSALG